jgi:hypothetical protein
MSALKLPTQPANSLAFIDLALVSHRHFGAMIGQIISHYRIIEKRPVVAFSR